MRPTGAASSASVRCCRAAVRGCSAPCPDGQACHLQCFPRTSCDGVVCAATQYCVDGACVENPCAAVTCAEGSVCVNGRCLDSRCKKPGACQVNSDALLNNDIAEVCLTANQQGECAVGEGCGGAEDRAGRGMSAHFLGPHERGVRRIDGAGWWSLPGPLPGSGTSVHRCSPERQRCTTGTGRVSPGR